MSTSTRRAGTIALTPEGPYRAFWASGHDKGCDLLSTPDHDGPCRCRCGKPVLEASAGCVWHEAR